MSDSDSSSGERDSSYLRRPHQFKYHFSNSFFIVREVEWLDVPPDAEKKDRFQWQLVRLDRATGHQAVNLTFRAAGDGWRNFEEGNLFYDQYTAIWRDDLVELDLRRD